MKCLHKAGANCICSRFSDYLQTVYPKLLLSFMVIVFSFNNTFAGCAVIDATVNNVVCYGTSTGSITILGSGGVTPYKYSLNAGGYGNSATFSNLVAGSYQINIKDASNCITSANVYIGQGSEIQANVVATPVVCRGTSTGTLQMNMESTPPYLFKLNSGTYQPNNFFNNLTAGNYTITVKDGNGCTKTVSGVVTQPASLPVLTATSTAVTCPNSSTGSITASGSGGVAPYSFNIFGSGYQPSGQFVNLPAGTYTVGLMDANGCVVTKSVTVGNASAQVCNLGYPDNSNLPRSSAVFNESEVLRAFDPQYSSSCASTASTIKLWYSDEHAMTLGVRSVQVKTASGTTTTNYSITPAATTGTTVNYPIVGSTISSGDQAGNDLAADGGRPLWPALFITDVTNNPANRSGDWQQGGTGIPPHRISGTWKGAVKVIDKTKNPVLVTITPDADPTVKNHWSLGAGGDAPPAGTVDDGYGCEVVWNISDLGLIQGHSYHLQFMVHDGDQNKTGGDVGQGCTTIYIPGNDKTDETSLFAVKSSNTEDDYEVHLFPNPFKNQIHVQVETGSSEPIHIKVVDAVGKLITERKDVSASYDLVFDNQLNTGIYFVEVKQGNHMKTIRMIEQK